MSLFKETIIFLSTVLIANVAVANESKVPDAKTAISIARAYFDKQQKEDTIKRYDYTADELWRVHINDKSGLWDTSCEAEIEKKTGQIYRFVCEGG